MPSKPARFSARVLKDGVNAYIEIPEAVTQAFSRYTERGRTRVYGRVEEASVRGNLVPRREGQRFYLHGGMRAAAGVDIGDTVSLTRRATPWNEVPIARDTRAALRKQGALEAYLALGPSQQHELQRWVDVAVRAEQRKDRLDKLVQQMLGRVPPRKGGQALKRARHEPFRGSEPFVRELFEEVRRRVESMGPVHLQAYRDRVAFLTRVRFLGAFPKKKWLELGFWHPRRIDSPRFHKIETLTPTDHIHRLRITDQEQLDDEVMDWIRQAYHVGEQRHLG